MQQHELLLTPKCSVVALQYVRQNGLIIQGNQAGNTTIDTIPKIILLTRTTKMKLTGSYVRCFKPRVV